MKASITVLLQLGLCLLLIGLSQAGGLSKGPKRSRAASSGLMPFPRVGRSGPMSWEVEPNDDHDEVVKRSKFMQFPRVGRASFNPYGGDDDYDMGVDKRAGGVPGSANKNSGLWFGPRLGRLHKRSDGRRFGYDGENSVDNMAAYAYLIELYPKQLHYAPRFANEPPSVQEQQTEEEQQGQRGQSSSLDMST